MVLDKRTLVESDAHHHTTGSTLRYTAPVGGTAYLIDIREILLGKLQILVTLLDYLLTGCTTHLDIRITGRVECLQDQGHVTVFLHQVEEVIGTEEISLCHPTVFLCIAQRSLAALVDDIVAYENLLIRLCPVA